MSEALGDSGGFPLEGVPVTLYCSGCQQILTVERDTWESDMVTHALADRTRHPDVFVAVDIDVAFMRLIARGWGMAEARRL